MSKIEKALRQAAQKRNLKKKDNEQEKSHPAAVPVSSKESEGYCHSGYDSLIGLDSRLVALFAENATASEQYKQLRTKILRSKRLYSHNAFLITSALPGEGKSVTAASLSISIAQGLQDTVLLVDADLRRPSIHKMLGIKMDYGLADCLAGKVSLEDVIYHTGIKKLSVIPAGRIPRNPSELITSDNMSNLISEVKTRYQNRTVIFDSPPVISITDSVVLGQKLDAVVLVIHAGKTPHEAITDTLNALSDTNVLGAVLNHYDSLAVYYRKYRYKYGYGYGYGYKSAPQKDKLPIAVDRKEKLK